MEDERHKKLADVRNALYRAISKRHGDLKISKIAISAIFIGLGSAVATVSQVVTKSGPYTGADWLSLTLMTVVFVGSILIAVLDARSDDTIERARLAIDMANEYQREAEAGDVDLVIANVSYDQLWHLTQALMQMRAQCEVLLRETDVQTIDDVLRVFMAGSDRLLRVAFGFEQDHRHTILIYQAVPDGDDVVLKCIAQDRSIKCELSNAFAFPNGVGVPGLSYGRSRELLVSDLMEKESQAVFSIPGKVVEDPTLYRSAIAIPVKLDPAKRPWGVLVTTIDQPDYFVGQNGGYLDHLTTARFLADAVSLLVAAAQRQPGYANAGASANPPDSASRPAMERRGRKGVVKTKSDTTSRPPRS